MKNLTHEIGDAFRPQRNIGIIIGFALLIVLGLARDNGLLQMSAGTSGYLALLATWLGNIGVRKVG